MNQNKRLVVTVTGPSASGKTELVKELENNYNFSRLISVTTRDKREGEVNAKDYYFIREDLFQSFKSHNELVQDINFNGKNYGTTTHEMERVFGMRRTPIVVVEPSGVTQFRRIGKERDFEVKSVFITAPYSILLQRFKSRNPNVTGDYEQQRIQSIFHEHATWLDANTYDVSMVNGEDDISSLKWLAKQISDDIEKETRSDSES